MIASHLVTDLEQQVLKLFRAIDDGDAPRVAAAFNEAGTWVRPGGERIGRAAVLEEMGKRPQRRRIRHLITNFIVIKASDATADAMFIALAYADVGAVEGTASPMSLPIALDDYCCKFAKEHDEWGVARLGARRAFANFSG